MSAREDFLSDNDRSVFMLQNFNLLTTWRIWGLLSSWITDVLLLERES